MANLADEQPGTINKGGEEICSDKEREMGDTMSKPDREMTANSDLTEEEKDKPDSDHPKCTDYLPVSSTSLQNEKSNLASKSSNIPEHLHHWGEIVSPTASCAEPADERTDGEVGLSSEEELSSRTPSSSTSSIAYSPALVVDDGDLDEETGVEESEDERCATPPFPVLSSKPVKGESFCACYQNGGDSGLYCTCGEEDSVFEWVWEDKTKSAASFLKQDLREVLFHVDFSCGTAGVRGTKAMKEDQYYWEVKMTTPVYGTDMMVGVGTGEVDLDKYRHMFCSLLGKDSESWGLSYNGFLQHKSMKKSYSSKFGQGTIIGVHLDMWHGTLSFYKNRKPLGVAYVGLQGKSIYPMVSSTAARSGMKVIRCRSFKTSLQFMCCQELRKLVPHHQDVLEALLLPPGLRTFLYNNVGWLLQPSPLEASDRCFENLGVRKRNFSEMDGGSSKEPVNKRLCSSHRNGQ